MNAPVLVVGSFIQDLTWRCAEFPQCGETVIGDFVTGPGGKGSNQAVAAARAGARTAFVGAVGRDVFAESARAFHAAEGIGGGLVSKAAHATGTAGIIVNRQGQNEIIVALGASAHLQPRDLPATLFPGVRVAVCQHESNLKVNAHVFRQARKQGARTVLNPAPMRPDFDARILELTDVLVPNETEFVALAAFVPAMRARLPELVPRGPWNEARLAALPEPALQALCRTLGVPVVIVTLGKRGCFVSEPGRGTAIPGHLGIQVLDTTGAGDAFVGGFAAGLVRHEGDVLAAARAGNAVAALSVTKFGTAPAMPTQDEVARFLRRRR